MLLGGLPEKNDGKKTREREIALPLNVFLCLLSLTWSLNGPKMMSNTCREAFETVFKKGGEK